MCFKTLYGFIIFAIMQKNIKIYTKKFTKILIHYIWKIDIYISFETYDNYLFYCESTIIISENSAENNLAFFLKIVSILN